MSKKIKKTTFIVFAAGIITGLAIAGNFNFNQSAISQPAPALDEGSAFSTAIEQVADLVGPAVVSIRVESTQKAKIERRFYGNASPFQDELFDRFFEEFFGDLPEEEFKRHGLGSGVIINADGYILTNEHVIDNADEITVTLADGREFKGTLKGTDPRSDLAVVKINASNLPAAQLGDSDNVKIGQWVVAIGNPFGYVMSNPEPTVTAGVISALHRSLPRTEERDSDYTDLLQTDAAINPGNSGGPLVNLKGEIVGINVAIFSTSGGYQGIGFAIPASTAKRIVESLIEGKKIQYGWIGVSAQPIDEKLAAYFGLPNTNAVLVSKVLPNSPAQKGGLKDGDVILAIDGKDVKNPNSLVKIIGNTPINKKVIIKILRDKKTLEVQITTASRPQFDIAGEIIEPSEPDEEKGETKSTWRGLSVEDISPEIAARVRIDDLQGVIVTSVADSSPAQEAGLRKGDIITSINQQPIKNVSSFSNATKGLKDDCLVQTIRGYIVVKSNSADSQ